MNGVRVKTEVEDSGYVSNHVNGMASYGVNVKTEVADSVGLVGGNCAPIPTSDEISCCDPALFDMHCYFDPVLYASLNYPLDEDMFNLDVIDDSPDDDELMNFDIKDFPYYKEFPCHNQLHSTMPMSLEKKDPSILKDSTFHNQVQSITPMPFEKKDASILNESSSHNQVHSILPMTLDKENSCVLNQSPSHTQIHSTIPTSFDKEDSSVLKKSPSLTQFHSIIPVTFEKEDSPPPKELPSPNLFKSPSPVSVLEKSNPCSSENTTTDIPKSPILKTYVRQKRSRSTAFVSCKVSCGSDYIAEERDTKKKKSETNQNAAAKKCTHCEVTQTPQWREGPMGRKTLCNACGVRYRSGRLLPEYRPANSPTFDPSLHSNFHKLVTGKGARPTKLTPDPTIQQSSSPCSSHSFVSCKVSCESDDIAEERHTKNKKLQTNQNAASKRCTHCGMTKTPQWRAGPMGLKTLCNACSVQYRFGRLLPEYRPADSPTFDPSQHSNSHKVVIEMRSKKLNLV